MAYATLEACLVELEHRGQLVRIHEEVDPNLEMATIHLRVFEKGGPALLFERLKGCEYRAASNIFGTMERCRYIFRDSIDLIPKLIRLQQQPGDAFKDLAKSIPLAIKGLKSIPTRVSFTHLRFREIAIDQLPLIKHWPNDGGAFITLPQVYSEDIDHPGVQNSNLGMYRIQLNGNDYELNKEIGLHYQIHRGIGIHQTKANKRNLPLRVSIFIGGPPAQTVAAIMPLPEEVSELKFAGILGNRRFRYAVHEGYVISADADFVITGLIYPNNNKPEGPFGDHLGYYSLTHPFPVMKVHKVYAKRNAIWPFTVVGRPPQEDTAFGNLIHELTGNALQTEIPGLKEVHAVDAAGVHPLLLAIGSERYTPFLPDRRPSEILTISNRILGTGQLSLAKYLFITAGDAVSAPPSTQHVVDFLSYLFERIDLTRDLHFQTKTSIDTLDYSGEGLNNGSKLIVAAYGEKKRELLTKEEYNKSNLQAKGFQWVMPGVLSVTMNGFTDYRLAKEEMDQMIIRIKESLSAYLNSVVLVVAGDDSSEIASTINNFLWISFTRTNPSHDVYGVDAGIAFKHWGCRGPLVIDARSKPFHAPLLIKDEKTEERIERIFSQGGSLYNKL